MTPDTLRIDIRVRGVGRIARASGTLERKTLRKMVRVLKSLSPERLDVLRAIRDGLVDVVDVYAAAQRHALHELPVGETMPTISKAMRAWIEDAEDQYSGDHLSALETSRRYFEQAKPDARIAELPAVLEQLRKTLGRKHPRSFNLARAHALAFIRSTLKRSHPIYSAVRAVEERAVSRRVTKVRITPAAFRALFPAPDANTKDGRTDRIAWSMAMNGMGQKELWGDWSIEPDRVHIDGTKRHGRVRDIPLVYAPAVPQLSRDRFEKNFRERMAKTGITPYHLRRTYIQWLEAAGIPRTRRRLYAGHGAKDVTDLYEAHEVSAFLADDAIKLRMFLGLPKPRRGKSRGAVGVAT